MINGRGLNPIFLNDLEYKRIIKGNKRLKIQTPIPKFPIPFIRNGYKYNGKATLIWSFRLIIELLKGSLFTILFY